MALYHSPKIVTDGLVLCLDSANRRSYSGVGTAWNDLSGNGNNGTLINGPAFDSVNGGSVIFDGVDDYAEINVLNKVQTLESGSIEVCFNWQYGDNQRFLYIGDPSYGLFKSGFYLFVGNTTGSFSNEGLRILFRDINNQTLFDKVERRHNDSYFYRDSKTHLWTIVQDGNSPKFYIDGLDITNFLVNWPGASATNTGAFFSNISVTKIVISADYYDGNLRPSQSNISYLSIYNRALSASEVQQNYNAMKWRFQ